MVNSSSTTAQTASTTTAGIPSYLEATRQVILMADHMPWPAADRYAGRHLSNLIKATNSHIGDDAVLDEIEEAVALVSDYLWQRNLDEVA